MSASPPRGMTTSTSPVSCTSSRTASRSVVWTSWTALAGSPAPAPLSSRTCAMARLDWMASLPPRRMTALAALRQRPAASAVTLGRDSYMKTTTPMGTATFCSRNPFGRVRSSSTRPTGSGRAATSRRPLAIAAIRLLLRASRSSIAADSPAARPAPRSCSFASWMMSLFLSRPSAIA